jgi:hypothetical protein
MKTLGPLDAVTQFINAMNKGDLETALGLYEPGASLVAQPGVVATGAVALREALAGFVALKPAMTSEAHQCGSTGSPRTVQRFAPDPLSTPTKPTTQATHSQPVRPEPVEGLHCTGPRHDWDVVRQAHHERRMGW